jgi:oligopeptide transport system substrate-binding protein
VPPDVEALFSRRTGRLSAPELAKLRATFEEAREPLARGAAEAQRRLGVDAGFFAKDERTLVVELRSPIPYFLELVTFYSMVPVPRWVVEKHPNDWFFPETFVGNGPFRLARWIVNDHVRLVKSETYWGKDEVRLSSIDALAVETEMPALNLYLTGKTQWFPKYLPRDLARALTKREDFRNTTAFTVYFYRLNTTRKPLDDKRVRKALNLAIDRKLITDNVTGFGEVPAYTLVPPLLPDYQSPPSGIRYDVREARELLREAGYPGGKGFPKLGILYNTLESHKKIADVIADQLRRNLGIEVQAYNQEWQSYLATARNLDYDIARGGWGGDYSDPNTFLDLWITNGGNNDTGFGNAQYDELLRFAGNVELFLDAAERVLPRLREPGAVRALLEPARSAPTPEARLAARAKLRMQLLREAEAMLLEDEFPIIPIYFYVNPNLVRPSVHGFYTALELPDGRTGVNLRDIHPLRGVWIDHAGESAP